MFCVELSSKEEEEEEDASFFISIELLVKKIDAGIFCSLTTVDVRTLSSAFPSRRGRREKRTDTQIDNVYLSIIIYYLLFIHHLQSSDRIEHDIFDRKNRVHEEEKKKKTNASELCSTDSRSERKWQITTDQYDAHVSGFFFFLFVFVLDEYVVLLICLFIQSLTINETKSNRVHHLHVESHQITIQVRRFEKD